MSFLSLIDEQKLVKVLDILPKYEKMADDGDLLFNLAGRRLEEIMRTLPDNQRKYDIAYKEMKALEEWLSVLKEKLNAKYWKKYVEGYPRQLGPKDIQAYVSGEKEMVEMTQIILEVALVKQRLESTVEGFRQMGFMMGHVTKIRVAEMQEAIF
jgi:hypothetical protein